MQAKINAMEDKRLKEEQEKRLEILRQKVASQFSHVTVDKDRVTQNTKAFQNALDAKECGELFPVHGYSADTLMKDQRFKLAAALHAAGLHTSDYARSVINRAAPAAPARPSMASNFELGGDH
mmetsp:Transcript_10040/g.19828  ORF Transcript_10040/g.19828 Transcript_10040/m.19828 type:complete len:123 (+) Transcript_10040:153-521(+)